MVFIFKLLNSFLFRINNSLPCQDLNPGPPGTKQIAYQYATALWLKHTNRDYKNWETICLLGYCEKTCELFSIDISENKLSLHCLQFFNSGLGPSTETEEPKWLKSEGRNYQKGRMVLSPGLIFWDLHLSIIKYNCRTYVLSWCIVLGWTWLYSLLFVMFRLAALD